MKKTTITLIIFAIFLTSCFNSSKEAIIVNSEIANKVNQHIIDTLNDQSRCSYLFLNKHHPTYYINDTLYNYPNDTIRYENYEVKWIPKKDTILIYGNNLRPDGTIGFKVEIINKKINVYGFVRTHILLNNLSNEPKGNMYNSIYIPTSNQKLVLSKIPNDDKDIIYGYLEFKTKEFYTFENGEYGEIENPKVENKIHYDMKVFFKASKCKKE